MEKKLGMVVEPCYPSYDRKPKIGELQSRLVWEQKKSKTLPSK
jgi:hypothetical protein